MTAPLCFIDTETDGVHPDRKVWEVAMIRRDESGERETQFYVDIDLSTADPFGLKVGGFYDRHPVGRFLSGDTITRPMRGVTKDDAVIGTRDAAETVAKWTHGAHLVGNVVNFDSEVLSNLLRAHALIPAWHYHLIDIEPMAVGYLLAEAKAIVATGDDDGGVGITTALPWNSEALSSALGVEPPSAEERHTAMGDARWAMWMYDAITGEQ